MNNKIIIKVYVPSLNNSYDIFIPINLTISDITKLINSSISEMTNGDFSPNNQLRLYLKDTGEIIEYNKIVKETSLRNGSKVILL